MSLTIAQDCEYKDQDWWEWAVWIDGTNEELAEIESVVYTLHPSFPNPVRTISNSASKFRLQTAGWGTFTVYAKVLHRDGKHTLLEHELELLYPDGTATTA